MTTSNCCAPAKAPTPNPIREFYNQAALGGSGYSQGTDKFSPGAPTESILRYIAARQPTRLLDIGCGMGTTLFDAAKVLSKPEKIIGIDFSDNMIKLARKRKAKMDASFSEKMAFFVADAQDLPFMDNAFDFIYSECVLNLVPDRNKVLQEVHRVLSPGGIFIYTDFIAFEAVPQNIRENINLMSGCRAGSLLLSENLSSLEQNGFTSFIVENHTEDKNLRYAEMLENSEEYRMQYFELQEKEPEASSFIEHKLGYYLVSSITK